MKAEILERNGSKVIIRRENGEVWETVRRKLRHVSHRRKITKDSSRTVRYIPVKRIVQKGDWLFTCKMEPVQFSHWIPKNPNDYTRDENITDEEWDKSMNFNDFETLDGSFHSVKDCSLHLITNKYAEFFIEKKLWELYQIHKDFNKYEEAVKMVCKAYNVNFEGI